MRTLSKKQVLALHSDLIREFGGTEGIRDEGLLESALAAPGRTVICSANKGNRRMGESPVRRFSMLGWAGISRPGLSRKNRNPMIASIPVPLFLK